MLFKYNHSKTFSRVLFTCLLCVCFSCQRNIYIPVPTTNKQQSTGTQFYNNVVGLNVTGREALALAEILEGNIPAFLKKFIPITSTIIHNGITHHARLYVSPDYLSIGNNDNWARIPLSPAAATAVADSFQCFLPTRKIVDLIYQQAGVKLEPVPMFAYRDSSITMWQHHLIIEGQRQQAKGLIAGIKKDVVLSAKVMAASTPKVAIYGWHQLNGKAIQPLYTGHSANYVDYSHGVRLIYRKLWVDGKEMDYTDVLSHPYLKQLICDEENCDFNRYPATK
jgi:hypothetical protein